MKKFLLALTLLAPTLFGASLPVAADSDGSLKTLTNGVTVKVKSANLDSSLDLSGKTINNANIVGATITGSSVAGTGNFETLSVTAVPTLPTDVVNKLYADTAATGLSPQTACALATTGNLTLSGEQTIDGVLTSGSRVLVKNQSAPAQNGIYVTAAGAWTRATDADTTGEVLVNQYYLVTGGSTNAGTGWFIQTAPATLGTNPLTFGQFSSLSGTFLKTNNLSDIPSASSARTNLGLGSIAPQNSNNVSITGGFLDGTTIGSITPYPATFNALGVTGNVTLNGAGRFILGDYSTLTQADRPFFKTSVSNGNTYLGARPDGTGTQSGFNLFGTSDVTTNTYRLGFTADSSQAGIINSLATGTATIRPLRLQVQSSTVGEFNTSGLAVTGTLSATGLLSSSAQFSSSFDHANGTYSRWKVGGVNKGIIGSANNLYGGSSGDFGINTEASNNLTLGVNSTPIATISSTGLTVTGALSATNGASVSFSGNNSIALQGTDGVIYRSGGTGTNAGFHRFRYFDTDVAVVSSTGLAVTGTTTSTNATIINSTGANDAFVSLNNTGGGFGGYTWNLRTYAANGKMSMYGLNDWLTVDYNTGATVFTTLSASSNANLRTTKNNLNITTFNVKDYGATGDGSTDDSAAIVSAVAAAKTVSGSVYFPRGTYKTDPISITSAAGLTLYGDGMGVSIIKSKTGSQVLHVYTSTDFHVHHLTFDGSCTARTAGQQAVIINASESSFCDNEVINSGEYAVYFGADSAINNVTVSRNYVHDNYADGINFGAVTRGIISDNRIYNVDDDCIAVGYSASGASSFISVTGNICKARTDLATSWGRGILVLSASDILVEGNIIEGIKQSGILLDDEGAGRPTRVQVIGNFIKGVAINSGHGITAYETTDCSLINNVVINPVQGSLIEIADWQNLTIQGGSLTQNNNVFGRAIHCDESSGWAASWNNLKILNVNILMTGASTNSAVYLSPHSSVTMNTGVIAGVTAQQVVAGDYIYVASARAGTLWKLVNNVTATSGRTVTPSSGGVFTTTNNN